MSHCHVLSSSLRASTLTCSPHWRYSTVHGAPRSPLASIPTRRSINSSSSSSRKIIRSQMVLCHSESGEGQALKGAGASFDVSRSNDPQQLQKRLWESVRGCRMLLSELRGRIRSYQHASLGARARTHTHSAHAPLQDWTFHRTRLSSTSREQQYYKNRASRQ
jgi:hypothetical protein